MDSPTLEDVRFYYPEGKLERERPTGNNHLGFHQNVGQIVAVSTHAAFYKNPKDEATAVHKLKRKLLWRRTIIDTLGHEIAHMFGSLNLYRGNMKIFYEAGCDYYSAEMRLEAETKLRNKHEGKGKWLSFMAEVFTPVSQERKRKVALAELYTSLLHKYGNDVHRLFHGTLPASSNKAKEITAEFTDESMAKYKNFYRSEYFG